MVEFELRLEQLARRETIKLEMNWRPEAVRVAESPELDEEEAPISELPSLVEPRHASSSAPSSYAPESSEPAWSGSYAPAPNGVFHSAEIHGAYPRAAYGAGPNGAGPNGAGPNGAGSEPAWAGAWHDLDVSELDGPHSAQLLDRIAAAEYQRLYTAARCLGSDGEWHLDKDQLIAGFARAGVDALTQQELYSLAAQADADGRSIMFSEQAITALKVASLRAASSSAAR